MDKLEFLLEQLEYAYSVDCPVCHSQWTYKVTGDSSWKEERTCDCAEYHKLIEDRLNEFLNLYRGQSG
jgi:hypothetical protein